MTKIGVYPGSFDPVTKGHLDIINKALLVVDHLIVAIACDTTKTPLFTAEERKEMIEFEINHTLGRNKAVEVKVFEGLLVNFVNSCGSSVIIRGLRAVSDFEYEFQMSCMNTKLQPNIQTIFLPASEKTHFISSKLIKQVARLNGDIKDFTSEFVLDKLKSKLKNQ